MGYHKKYDLSVKTGTYEKNGETKGKYTNVGLILENDEGKRIVMIDPLFNFGAVRREEGKDMVMVSMFEPKKDNQKQATSEEE